MKIGIVFGGMSTEHDVSVVSGKAIMKNIDTKKYEIIPIYINEEGDWFGFKNINDISEENAEKISDIIKYLKQCDVVFPVLHGKYGEDGTIQGLLELLKIPYVGPGVLASSIAMDKVYAKMIFEKANLKQAQYVYLKSEKDEYVLFDNELNEEKTSLNKACEKIEKTIKYPMFVKPSNSGSSIGINKIKNTEELKEAIEFASKYDSKILIEEGIIGKEIECAILGNSDIKASSVGEIRSGDEFYSFDAKYDDSKSDVIIPANVSEDIVERVKTLAKKAFMAIDGKGFSRIDFFVNTETNEIFINEINTIPGFTPTSMYPKLWEYDGIKYSELIEKLILLAIEK